MKEIIIKKLEKIKTKYFKKGVKVDFTDEFIEELKELSNYKEFGARKIGKIIKDKVENQIVSEILKDKKKIHLKTLKEETTV